MRYKLINMYPTRRASQNDNKFNPKCNSEQTISSYKLAYETGAGQYMSKQSIKSNK